MGDGEMENGEVDRHPLDVRDGHCWTGEAL